MYDEDYQYYNKYKKIDWQDVNTWEFIELNAATTDYIDQYFNQKRFFDRVNLMDKADLVINQLARTHDIVFVSAGYSPNLKLKQEYIEKLFADASFIPVNMKEYYDKSHIDMSGGIFLDDCESNLKTSNAKYKICFGKVYPWNESWDGKRSKNWIEVLKLVKDIEKVEQK